MELFYTAIAWFFGGLAMGLSGMGAALVTVPVMTLYLDIHFVIILSNVALIHITGLIAWQYRKHSELKNFIPMYISFIPGIAIGTLILYIIPAVYLQIIMSTFLISYVVWSVLKKTSNKLRSPEQIRKAMYICGFFAGLFGSSISFPGPIFGIFVLYAKYGTKKSLAVMCEGACIFGILTSLGYFISGLYTVEMIPYSLIILPTVTIGIFAAKPFIKYITDERFKIMILCVLGFSATIATLRAFMQLGIF